MAAKKKYPYFYERNNLKHVTGFLSAADLKKLKGLAQASDKSVTRYVTRLLETHLREAESKLRSSNPNIFEHRQRDGN